MTPREHLKARWESEPDLVVILDERELIGWFHYMPSSKGKRSHLAELVIFGDRLGDVHRHAKWKAKQYVKKGRR